MMKARCMYNGLSKNCHTDQQQSLRAVLLLPHNLDQVGEAESVLLQAAGFLT